jgi:hypothetical protein
VGTKGTNYPAYSIFMALFNTNFYIGSCSPILEPFEN